LKTKEKLKNAFVLIALVEWSPSVAIYSIAGSVLGYSLLITVVAGLGASGMFVLSVVFAALAIVSALIVLPVKAIRRGIVSSCPMLAMALLYFKHGKA
jgi:uncharacterized membrane protein